MATHQERSSGHHRLGLRNSAGERPGRLVPVLAERDTGQRRQRPVQEDHVAVGHQEPRWSQAAEIRQVAKSLPDREPAPVARLCVLGEDLGQAADMALRQRSRGRRLIPKAWLAVSGVAERAYDRLPLHRRVRHPAVGDGDLDPPHLSLPNRRLLRPPAVRRAPAPAFSRSPTTW